VRIEFLVTDEKNLDLVRRLWEKLNQHHTANSKYFSARFARRTFGQMAKTIMEKAETGTVRIDLARDMEAGRYVGYCISTISLDNVGQVETLYVEEDCRGLHIGDGFMKRALTWMDEKRVKTKTIFVAVGNDKVIDFYRRYGFYPLLTKLQQQ